MDIHKRVKVRLHVPKKLGVNGACSLSDLLNINYEE